MPTSSSGGLWHNQQPSITRASRQLRAESLSTFYSFCTFYVWNVCGLCRPTEQKILARQIQHGPSNTCRCIPHRCYRSAECRWEYVIGGAWRWVHAIGDLNLSHIRKITLRQSGNTLFGHVGYSIIILQHPRTKRLTLSDESFWQYDKRRFPCKIMGSSPEGQAIIRHLSRLLEQHGMADQGLTAASIELILKDADVRSFTRKRGPRDMDAWSQRPRG